MTTKKKKELQPSNILLTLLILYIILYLLFIHSRANEADKTLFDTIGNILGLGINAMTILFVFKTYKSQKDQIEFQQKEIEDNKKDVEFNRAADLTFKQLEYTISRYNSTSGENIFRAFESLIIHLEDKFSELGVEGRVYFPIELVFRSHKIKLIYSFLEKELDIYRDILSEINSSNRQKLLNIIMMNIDESLHNNLIKMEYYIKFIDLNEEINEKHKNEIKSIKEKVFYINKFLGI